MEEKYSKNLDLKYELIEYLQEHNSFDEIFHIINMSDKIKAEFLKSKKQLIALQEFDEDEMK